MFDPAAQSYRPMQGEIDPEVARHPRAEVPRRAVRQAARAPAPAGAVSVGDLSRPVSLLRLSPRHHRGQRARCRSRDPLGLRLEAGAVRNLAGRRLAAGRRLGRGRYRRGQGARRGSAARLGDHRAGRSRACIRADGAYSPATDTFQPRSSAARLCAAVLSGSGPGRGAARGRRPFWKPSRALVAHGRRHRHRFVQEQAAHDQRRGARRAARARSPKRSATGAGWSSGRPASRFHSGADLASLVPTVQAAQWDSVEGVVAKFQQTSQRLRYSLIPTVAAVRGMALGGACELIMHCDRAVAALESYIGLVEAGVGILPAGGGCKELAARAAQEAVRGANGGQLDQFPFLRTYFQQVAHGQGVEKRARGQGSGLSAPCRRRRLQSLRAAMGRQGAGARPVGERLSSAAASYRDPGRGQDGHRDAGDDAGQHARRRLHLAPTTSKWPSPSRGCCAAASWSRAAWSTRAGCSSSSVASS